MDNLETKLTGVTELGGKVTPLDVVRDKGVSKMGAKALTLVPPLFFSGFLIPYCPPWGFDLSGLLPTVLLLSHPY